MIAAASVTVFGIALAAAHRPILEGFARLFRVDNAAPSDAIVVLLGGLDHRPARAAELYRAGLAPTVVFGTSAERIAGVRDETPSTLASLVSQGVPRSAIVVLPELVTSTRHEAMAVARHAEGHGWRRITLVTTGFHTARALWIFRKAMTGKNIDVRVAAARNPGFGEEDWFHTDEGLLAYLNEAFKTVYYRVRY